MDTETLAQLQSLMHEATDRIAHATKHQDDAYLWSQFDGLLFALGVFKVIVVFPVGTPGWDWRAVPTGYELQSATEPSRYFSAYGEERFKLEHSLDGFLVNVHDADKCAGEFCTIHNRSDHHMRSFPQHWRSDTGVMERTCPHGVGHPDPDLPYPDDAWQWVHGCDGCCLPAPTTLPTPVPDVEPLDSILDPASGETLIVDSVVVDGRGLYLLLCTDATGAVRFITGSPDASFERVVRAEA